MKKTDSKANREAYAKLSSLYKEWIQQCRSIVVANTIASYKASLKLFFLEYLQRSSTSSRRPSLSKMRCHEIRLRDGKSGLPMSVGTSHRASTSDEATS